MKNPVWVADPWKMREQYSLKGSAYSEVLTPSVKLGSKWGTETTFGKAKVRGLGYLQEALPLSNGQI